MELFHASNAAVPIAVLTGFLGAGYEPLVAAHSRALDSIAREIAEGLRTMSR